MGADRIVSGSMAAASYDSPGALIADQLTGMLGVKTTSQGVVVGAARAANIPQQPPLTNITGAQTVLAQSIPAGMLNTAGRAIRVRGTMIYSTTAGNVATITIALMLGATTLCSITTAATNTAASSGLQLQFEFNLTTTTTGAAGTITTHGSVNVNLGTATSGNTTTFLDSNTGASTPVNLTIPQNLTVMMLASAAIPSAQLLNASIDILA